MKDLTRSLSKKLSLKLKKTKIYFNSIKGDGGSLEKLIKISKKNKQISKNEK